MSLRRRPSRTGKAAKFSRNDEANEMNSTKLLPVQVGAQPRDVPLRLYPPADAAAAALVDLLRQSKQVATRLRSSLQMPISQTTCVRRPI